MNRREIVEFVRKHPTSYLATIEAEEPRVRAMQTTHSNSHNEGEKLGCTRAQDPR